MNDLFEHAAQEAAREHYRELCETIRRNDELYYAKATPELSDAEYDALYRELEQLEREHPDWVTPDSPTRRVCSDCSKEYHGSGNAVDFQCSIEEGQYEEYY